MLAAAKKPEAESAVENKAEPEAPASPSKRGAPKEKPPDEYEKDTEAPEEVNLTELLLPDGSLPRQSFALTYSMAALDGWVKQASPACAAASVAGAWNALMALKRRDDGALTQADVLGVYRTLLEQSCEKKRNRIERLLGGSIGPIDAALRVKVDATGKSFGGKKELKVGRKELLRLFKEAVHEGAASAAASEEGAAAEGGGAPSSTAAAVADADATEVVEVHVPSVELTNPFLLFEAILKAEGDQAEVVEDEGEEGDEEDNDEPASGAAPAPAPAAPALDPEAAALAELAAGIGGNGATNNAARGGQKPWLVKGGLKGGKGKKVSKAKSNDGDGGWAWRSDVASYYAVVGGLEKLNREKPSTGFFGNADVIDGMRALSEVQEQASCRILPFMGKVRPAGGAGLGFVKLSNADDEVMVAEQWASLRARFSQPHTILISHHVNHYALIFALREWHEPINEPTPRGPDGAESAPSTAPIVSGTEDSGAAATCRPAIECGGYRVVREMLTARKGQRPQVWIPWEEARQTMLKWNGYKMLAVERTL